MTSVLIGSVGSGKTYYVREQIKNKKVYVVDKLNRQYKEYPNQVFSIDDCEIIVFENISNIERDLSLIGEDKLKSKEIYLLLEDLSRDNLDLFNTFEKHINVENVIVFKCRKNVTLNLLKKYFKLTEDKVQLLEELIQEDGSYFNVGYYVGLYNVNKYRD